jgi:transposase
MDEARRKQFLLEWRKATATGEACFHDITSISSYSLKSDVVEYGYNRDKEDLPQINLGMVTDSGNRLALYYRSHDGSISDVATLKHVLHEGYAFNMNKLTFVMDKGFFSTQNIGMMYSYGYHFIISMTL